MPRLINTELLWPPQVGLVNMVMATLMVAGFVLLVTLITEQPWSHSRETS